MYWKMLLFKVIINISATADFPSLSVEYIFLKNCYKIHNLHLPMFYLTYDLIYLRPFEMH